MGNLVSINDPQPYQSKEAERVRSELSDIMAENGYNVVHLARHLDVGRSSLQILLCGTYSAPEEMAGRLGPGLASLKLRIARKGKEPESDGEVFQTAALEMCQHVLEVCRVEGELGVAFGPAGVGKTFAIRAYVQGRDDTFLLEANESWGKFGALKVLAEMLELDPDRHSRLVLNDVVEALILKPRLVIVDEADLIPLPGLDVLRAIFDACGGRMSLVLVGEPKLYHNMTRGRSGRANLRRLYSRVHICGRLPMPSEAEVRAYVKSRHPKATEDAIKALAAEGETEGMRRVAKLLKGAAQVAQMNECELDAEVVEVAATRTMMIA